MRRSLDKIPGARPARPVDRAWRHSSVKHAQIPQIMLAQSLLISMIGRTGMDTEKHNCRTFTSVFKAQKARQQTIGHGRISLSHHHSTDVYDWKMRRIMMYFQRNIRLYA
jgi:hypothetical protein